MVQMKFLLLSACLMDAAFAELALEGASSSILFDNNARLTTTCQNSVPPPPPPLAPAVVRMQPTSYASGVPAGASVSLRLKDVPLSCSDTPANVPCALPFDEMDGPMWSCLWNNSHSSSVVGPLSADVSFHSSLNSTEQEAMRLSFHKGKSPCAAFCERYEIPSLVKPMLECPLPADLSPFLPSGPGKISLFVSFRGATQVPFVGLSNEIEITFSPPMPPMSPPLSPPSPPPPPPPPMMPPPPKNFPWYKYTLNTVASNPGNDIGVRLVPVYISEPQSYTFDAYKQACSGAKLRTYFDCAGQDTIDAVYTDYSNLGAPSNAGGHDIMTNLIYVMQGNKESGHNGHPLVDKEMMAADLKSLGVPDGNHRIGIKHSHCGTEPDSASFAFTLSGEGTNVSPATTSYEHQTSEKIDIFMCACRMGVDCDGDLFSTRSNCPTSGSNPCS